MPFKRRDADSISLESPQAMFRDFSARKIPGVLDYQGAVLTDYQTHALSKTDVAVELPTGAGKTLIGLLIAEWRRRTRTERVAYFCPTVQLANQTAVQAREKYGMAVSLLTGSAKHYSSSEKNAYQSGEAIAISTYSSLFNTNPFFSDGQLFIFDDAHAAENYFANLWRVEITRDQDPAVFDALATVLDSLLLPSSKSAFHATSEQSWDRAWVELMPIQRWYHRAEELIAILDSYADGREYRFPWSMLKQHIFSCNLYLGPEEVLIRPVSPPTRHFKPFWAANQRIFMSATLADAGDIERLLGVPELHRLNIPTDIKKQGVGRRFFIFPGKAQDGEDATEIEKALIAQVQRALVLVPSNKMVVTEREALASLTDYTLVRIDELEQSKDPFLHPAKAIAVLAGRYDGLDFPDDECRLLVIRGLPGAFELQEQFLRNKASAAAYLSVRIRTRIIQAVGRCTRGANDYSAVVVLEDDLLKYFQQKDSRTMLPTEMQAEILFGLEQSQGEAAEGMSDQLRLFLARGEDWANAESDIRAYRADLAQHTVEYARSLEDSAKRELDWQHAMWAEKYTDALDAGKSAVELLGHPHLKGYKAFWAYLTGAAAFMATHATAKPLGDSADFFFRLAAKEIPSLGLLAGGKVLSPLLDLTASSRDEALQTMVERIETQLLKLGLSGNKKYDQNERNIRESLLRRESTSFERGLVLLGTLLGFDAGKIEEDASPDPWWLINDYLGVVFEAHTEIPDDSQNVLGARKAREAASHPKWVKKKVAAESATIIPVLLTDAAPRTEGASIQLEGVSIWRLSDFRDWATEALAIVRQLRRDFPGRGNIVWRSQAADALTAGGIAPDRLIPELEARAWTAT